MTQDKITKEQKQYPKLLREIGKDAPKQLYYRGVFDKKIFENCLAVVGSRRMTSYGKRVAEQIVGEIANSGITIVSGFMHGVDAASHRAALKAGGRTIAVMPCGIERIHPEYQENLYQDILNNQGLVVSEYEGSMLPSNWTYPRRNRIVAGMAQATLVIEAGEKSGSLITASCARKFGRKLFAVPGPITSEVSKGTNQLLKEGAVLVAEARDILSFFFEGDLVSLKRVRETKSLQKKSLQRNDFQLGKTERSIVEYLKGEPMEIDTLSRALHIPASQLGAIISMMELSGEIVLEGNTYHLKQKIW